MSISAYSSNSITIIVIILHFLIYIYIYIYIVFLKINILNPIYWKFQNVWQFQKSNINYFDVIYFCHSFCSFHITPTNVNIKNKKAFEIEIKQNNIVFFIRLMWLSFSLLHVPLKYMGLCKKYWRQLLRHYKQNVLFINLPHLYKTNFTKQIRLEWKQSLKSKHSHIKITAFPKFSIFFSCQLKSMYIVQLYVHEK
jgi:hypothetical protein